MISLLIFVPLVAAALAPVLPGSRTGKWLALGVSAVTTLLALGLWLGYDLRQGGFQYLQQLPWIPNLGIGFTIALDGLSLPFVFLTSLLTFVSVLAEWRRDDSSYFALFLLMQAALTAVFAALDLILFFVAFELVLIPMFFIIGVWGYQGRRRAALKFLLYSLFGSVFLLVAILATGLLAAGTGPLSFDLRLLDARLPALRPAVSLLLCGGFALAFLIKLPAVPFHAWLPHAHTEAPTGGSILLAGVLLKIGGYGLIRFNLTLFPEAMHQLAPYLAALAVLGLLYGGVVALGQSDLKRLVAYSSVNHMGFVLLGISSLTAFGLHGAVYVMVAHGVITGLLFMLVGMLSARTHTRTIVAMRGMYTAMPLLGGFLWLAFLGGAGIPGMAGFIGEFQALLGAFSNPRTTLYAVLGVFGVLINAGLMLWVIQRVLQGAPTTQMKENYLLHDLAGIELAAALPLVVLAVLWGLWPPSLTPFIDAGLQPALQALAGVTKVAGF